MEARTNSALAQAWKSLQADLQYHDKLDYDTFKSLFTETYGVLSQCAVDAKIGREYFGVIINASSFASTKLKTTDDTATAALVLTERMLQRCVLDTDTTAPCTGAKVYILEEREEIYLDFRDVDQSFRTLQEVLKKHYWSRHG